LLAYQSALYGIGAAIAVGRTPSLAAALALTAVAEAATATALRDGRPWSGRALAILGLAGIVLGAALLGAVPTGQRTVAVPAVLIGGLMWAAFCAGLAWWARRPAPLAG
jgi:hypothetical protein